MFLELAKFASLLLSILSLDALFHTAFLEPGSQLEQRLLPSLGMLLLAAAVCLASGFVFHAWECKVSRRGVGIAASLPMLIFWWGAGAISLLFTIAWFIERDFPGLWA